MVIIQIISLWKVNIKSYEIKNMKIVNKCPRYEQLFKYYIYSYIEDKDNYYVYVAYGNVIYQDNIYKLLIDEDNIYLEKESIDDLSINSDNYEEFNKYKITYIKDGYDMYFYSIERIQDEK